MANQETPGTPDPDHPPLGERLNDRVLAVMFRYFDFRSVIVRPGHASPRARRHARAHQFVVVAALLWIAAEMLLARFVVPAGAALGLKLLLAALLLPPIIAVGVVWMRQLLESDELQQRIELLAMATTGMVVACVAILFMLLHDMRMQLQVPLFAFLWLVVGSYWVARAWLRYRYR